MLYGARTSLRIAALVLLLSAAVGVPLGVIAGYVGGWVDDVIMRITDVFLAFPALLLSLALASVLSPSVGNADARHRRDLVAVVRAARARRRDPGAAGGATSSPRGRSGCRARASSSATCCPTR